MKAGSTAQCVTNMNFAQELKELTKQKSGAKIAARQTLDYVREKARQQATWGFSCLQLDEHNSNITHNTEVLKLIEDALMADGFAQVIVRPGVIAIAW